MADAAHGARRAARAPGGSQAGEVEHECAGGELGTSVDSGYAWADTRAEMADEPLGPAPLVDAQGAEDARGADDAHDAHDARDDSATPAASTAPAAPAGTDVDDVPHPPLYPAPRRPPQFAAMHRLRSPWSASNSLARLAMHRSQSGYASSTVSAPPSALEAVVDTPPTSETPSVHTDAADARDDDAPEPIARPFLHLALLRKITEACIDAASTVPDGAHTALGTPCMLQVGGGLIAVGTTLGATLVFDLSQRLRCVCRARAIGTSRRTHTEPTHPVVTALALSSDASYVGVAHASGDIFLYDVADAEVPVRHVVPVHAADVAAGRSEGHLAHTPVTHLAFVGRRKTAIVSADAHGLCFYHSLGRVLGMASHDTLRVYGRYPGASAAEPLLDVAPLPCGTAAHGADAHKFVALLLRGKLLLLGLAPAAQTWYRSHAPPGADAAAHDTGALAWFPATEEAGTTHAPQLAYAFGRTLHILRLRAVRVRPRAGRAPSETGIAIHETHLATAPHAIVRLQWVHRELLLVVTTDAWLLYDAQLRAFSEWQPHDPAVAHLGAAHAATWRAALHVWHSKVFCLAYGDVYVGDFLAWDTRLAQLERAHDYLGALHLGLALYHGRGLGSGIGLPRAPAEQRAAVAARLDTLQRRAARALFATPHVYDDAAAARGAVARACAAIATATHDVAWLFDELYTLYETHGAESVFVHEMEPFIVHGEMPTPAPGVLQRLLAFRARTGDLDRVTQLVLHVDPWHLDLDQTLSLCRRHRLWDAYISVSLRALHDALTPARLLLERVHAALRGDDDARDAYTLYAFLASTARGVLHPTDAPLDDAARAAAAAVFPWVLRAAGGGAPPLDALLALDAEALLDALDVAFEGELFDEDRAAAAHAPTRRDWVDALLAAHARLAPSGAAFVALFVARNSAKYPQFVQLRADEVRAVFATLTRPTSSPAPADCELGLECLFSAYALPWDDAEVRAALRTAQYWRVYEYALRKAHDLDALLRFFLTDEDGEHHTPGQLYSRVAQLAPWPAFGARLRPALLDALADVPDSLLGDVAHIATRFAPHDTLDLLAALADAPQRQYLYLAPFFPLDARTEPRAELKRAWVALVAHFCPATLATHLEARAPAFFDLAQVVDVARTHRIYDALLLAHTWRDEPHEARAALDAHVAEASVDLLALATQEAGAPPSQAERLRGGASDVLHALRATVRMATRLAVQHAAAHADGTHARDEWTHLLRALIHYVHALGDTALDARGGALLTYARTAGDELMHESLTALLTSVPTETLSFPDLFRELVGAPDGTSGVAYADVRRVLDEMLSTYRMRRDVLALGVRMNEADTARLFHELAAERARGVWVGAAARCDACHARVRASATGDGALVLSRDGALLHRACRAQIHAAALAAPRAPPPGGAAPSAALGRGPAVPRRTKASP